MSKFHYYKKILAKSGNYINKLFFTISILILVMDILFLYRYCYLTMHDAKVVLALKNQLAVKVVDTDKWANVNKNMEWKRTSPQEAAGWDEINDPF